MKAINWPRSWLAGLTALLFVACGGSSPQSSSNSSDPSAKLKSECASIRSQYSNIPKQITVAVSPFNAAIEQTDPKDPSKIVGVEPEVVSAVATCLGFSFTYSSQAFAGVLTALTSGNAQLGITGLFITPERIKVIDMVSHMASVDQVFTTPALNPSLKKPLDLCGHKLGQTVGTAEAAYVEKLSQQCASAGKPAIQISQFPDLASLPLNLSNGRIEATVNADVLKSQMVDTYPGKVVAGFYINDLSFEIGLGISKQTASTKFPQAVEAAVKHIQDNGMEASILQKWGFPKTSVRPAKLSGE